MTAGDTAAMTLPIIAASNRLTPNNAGANRTVPANSAQAGRKHIRTAGRPTFFKSDRFKDNPALVNMITSAICLKSAEIFKMDSSIKSSA